MESEIRVFPQPLVYIATPFELINQGLSKVLQDYQIKDLGHATTFPDTISGIALQNPDILLVDIELPELHLRTLTPVIEEHNTKVILLAPKYHPVSCALFRKLGYIYLATKNDPAEKLAEMIYLLKGNQLPVPEVSSEEIEPFGPLSYQEADVMRLVLMGYTNKQIALRKGLSVKTIERQRLSANEKVGSLDQSELFDLMRSYVISSDRKRKSYPRPKRFFSK